MNFTGADLSGADLSGADVDSADFVDTRMDGVVLDGIEGLEDAYVVSIVTPDGRLEDEAALAWLLARVAQQELHVAVQRAAERVGLGALRVVPGQHAREAADLVVR